MNYKSALRANVLRVPIGMRGGESEPLRVYRGVTQAEMDYIRKHGHIKSTQAFSLSGEGTSFAGDRDTAESYVNFGRDDPRKTGKPTYVLHVRHSGLEQKSPEGYYKAQKEVPTSHIVHVERHNPDGSVTHGSWKDHGH